jgi:hypothetical protein
MIGAQVHDRLQRRALLKLNHHAVGDAGSVNPRFEAPSSWWLCEFNHFGPVRLVGTVERAHGNSPMRIHLYFNHQYTDGVTC